MNRRRFLGGLGAAGLASYASPAQAAARSGSGSDDGEDHGGDHERFTLLAIEEGRKNERYRC